MKIKKTKTAEAEAPKGDAEKAETPRGKFLRLAPKRTENALKRIDQLGNLAGAGYLYEPAEAQQIMDALFDAVHDLKRKFEKRKSGGKAFTFKPSQSRAAA